jgi:hypothetical protein
MALNLDDAQWLTVDTATRMLDHVQREAFMAALDHLFVDKTEIGPGELYQALRELQHEFYRYPVSTGGTRRTPARSNPNNSAMRHNMKPERA